MHYLQFTIALLLIGILGAANLIIARLPAAKEYIAKIAPYQGWIGLVSIILGAWSIFDLLIPSIRWMTDFPLRGVLGIATTVVLLLLGFLLGLGMIKTFVKDPQTQAKLDQMAAKLAPYQGIMGIIAIVLAILDLFRL